jgi:hypothetical protein
MHCRLKNKEESEANRFCGRCFFCKITEQYATKKQKLQQQQHNISIVFLLKKIQPSTEQMLVEAGYKMS